ncbi:MAG: hypothetical protein DCF22_12670 [Leptolyngbya sp.]|nr:MAG: hypothetical protein DCF22_12670 [Leptolyngbya sp.]
MPLYEIAFLTAIASIDETLKRSHFQPAIALTNKPLGDRVLCSLTSMIAPSDPKTLVGKGAISKVTQKVNLSNGEVGLCCYITLTG